MAEIVVTGNYDNGEINYEEFDIDENILLQHDEKEINTSKDIFFILLDDWMYGYKIDYTANHFHVLFEHVLDIVQNKKVLDFLLPGFPVKSMNKVKKVLGTHADFGEYLALRGLVQTARKLEKIYEHGITVTIMSDYHTFDQFIGVTEETYNEYHSGLKTIIRDLGGDDVVKLISLASFPEFEATTPVNISRQLHKDYGCQEFVDKFDENIKIDESLLKRYTQMKKFMQSDQETRLPGSPKCRKTHDFVKEIAIGMISQGNALDLFLREQTLLDNYIRISIHAHHPVRGKFAVDLFKWCTKAGHILRTPWHHAVLLDTKQDTFIIERKDRFIHEDVEHSVVVNVNYKERAWLLVRIYTDQDSEYKLKDGDLVLEMIKQGCGLKIKNVTNDSDLSASIIDKTALTSLIKHFGVVVLQDFKTFSDEKELFDFYYTRGTNGLIPWKNGQVHAVKFCKLHPGYVNRREKLPIHFDLSFPPTYMKIDQSVHQYEDYVPREFILYCHKNSKDGKRGATTFVDAAGVVLSIPHDVMKELKDVELTYETQLVAANTNTDLESKQGSVEKKIEGGITRRESLYFGGEGNTYTYQLVMSCPWTKQKVLRWQEFWSVKDHPDTVQEQAYRIENKKEGTCSEEELEEKLRNYAFDERFFFNYSSEEGDQVYVNNYTVLHGRESFTNERELWRVQLVPPTDNIPQYFQDFGHKYY